MPGTNYTVKFIDSATSFPDFFLIYSCNLVTSFKDLKKQTMRCA
ncbi:hypothetical protein SAMN05444841_1017 [Enterobacter kobei]|jgi:hypothetical protein|nr:hypothetical protein SAMN05444841_1017 [Enterobacter kobei]